MAENTKIEWCDYTWSPVTGCKHGCPYCYARKIAERYDQVTPATVVRRSFIASGGFSAVKSIATCAGNSIAAPAGFAAGVPTPCGLAAGMPGGGIVGGGFGSL